jgi:lipid II:glycine glycyltransferase (peptidoglycan interpeptide bridge formation enzyme)
MPQLSLRPPDEADRDIWQDLLARLPSGDLLHDWEWARVAAYDRQPQTRYLLESDGEPAGLCVAQVRRTTLGRTFWYVPRGPVLDYDYPEAAERLRAILRRLRLDARQAGAIAVRLEPRVPEGGHAAALFDAAGLRRVEDTLQAPQTYLVDLTDDEPLLASFDKDTRYAIRRSAREGVTTTVIDDPADDQAVVRLHGIVTETLQRADYKLPILDRYRAAWQGLGGAGRARIIEAWYQGRLESAAMMAVEGDRSYYLYSGSIREQKGETKRFASYAVQWQMMRTARELGARVHDLWGVAPLDAGPEHPWYGYSLFKKGFGGHYVAWAGSWDMVIDPFVYRIRSVASAIRSRLSRQAPAR